MFKKIKLSVCCILTLVLMFTMTSVSAFASDTKTLTVTVNKTFTCTGPEVTANMQSIRNSTYGYNDGAYQGVLNYSQINSATATQVGLTYNNIPILSFVVSVTYTGTVTKIDPPVTKSINVTLVKYFSCYGPQAGNNIQAITSSTYSYDDGNFRGTLNYLKIDDVKATVVGHDSNGDILSFSVTVEYSGTVTAY